MRAVANCDSDALSSLDTEGTVKLTSRRSNHGGRQNDWADIIAAAELHESHSAYADLQSWARPAERLLFPFREKERGARCRAPLRSDVPA
jgi:hypothetical protein